MLAARRAARFSSDFFAANLQSCIPTSVHSCRNAKCFRSGWHLLPKDNCTSSSFCQLHCCYSSGTMTVKGLGMHVLKDKPMDDK